MYFASNCPDAPHPFLPRFQVVPPAQGGSAARYRVNILWWFRRDSVAAAHRLQRLATEQQIHADFCSGRTERMVSQKRPFGVAAWSSTKRPLTMTSPSEKVIKASLK